jgi:ribosome-interacting GTPase 1
VADMSSDTCLDDTETCLRHLAERRIALTDGPRLRPAEPESFLQVPGLVLANKIDAPGAGGNLAMARELLERRAAIQPLSTRDATRMAHVPELLFKLIHVIRVYAKPPGRRPDLAEPFVLPAGSDVHELARRVYRGYEHQVRSARRWGRGVADGQNVQLDHVLHDKDIVELHD